MYVQFIYYVSLQLTLGWLLGWAAAVGADAAGIVYTTTLKNTSCK